MADPERARQAALRSYNKHIDKRREEGRARYAIDGAESKREWNRANPEKCKKTNKKWRLKNVKKVRANGKVNYEKNKERRIKMANEWNRANPKKRSAIMVFQNAKRRSRIKANGGRGFTKKHWDKLLSKCGGMCAYCRRSKANSVDHFIPIALGGSHDFANIIPSCAVCNSTKRENEPVQWIVGRYGEEALQYVRSIMIEQ